MKRFFQPLTKLLRPSKKTVLLTIAVAVATIVIITAISIWLSRVHNLRVPSIGTIYTIGVKAYWDANLENETKEIQWGTTYPGSLSNVTFYAQSESTVETILELRTANWVFRNSTDMIVSGPSESTQYMNLTWNYNNATIRYPDTVQVTLTLRAEDSTDFILFLIDKDVKYFSFDIIIHALEVH